eukprot:COSAG04_NODE_224_length_19624_cov_47.932855_2_plen_36_part_00
MHPRIQNIFENILEKVVKDKDGEKERATTRSKDDT